MTDLHNFINEIESYCAESGIKPEYLCRLATNNARLFERLQRRADKTAADVGAIRDYMAAHPPQPQSGAS